MSKPLFRFTIGPSLQQGLDILAESIKKTTKVLGISTFDWLICYNGIRKESLQKIIGNLPIHLFEQSWSDCPVDITCGTPRRPDGSFEWNGKQASGTMWKVCPPRLRMESHEIVMDNDIILLKKFPEIDEFLGSNKALILEEPIRFYGKYDHLFPEGEPYLNSGFMGLPPNYDYAREIRRVWEENGKFQSLSQADEQALLTYTLSQTPNIRIKKTQIIECLAKDYNIKITGKEEGIHFVQSNKIPHHVSWKQYKKIVIITNI